MSATDTRFFPKIVKMPKVNNITKLPQIIVIASKKLAAMVSKQFNLFITESQNTQFSFYFVSQVVIQNERLHNIISLL